MPLEFYNPIRRPEYEQNHIKELWSQIIKEWDSGENRVPMESYILVFWFIKKEMGKQKAADRLFIEKGYMKGWLVLRTMDAYNYKFTVTTELIQRGKAWI